MAQKQLPAVCVRCEQALHPGEKVLVLLGATLTDEKYGGTYGRPVRTGYLRLKYHGRGPHQGLIHTHCYVDLMKRGQSNGN